MEKLEFDDNLFDDRRAEGKIDAPEIQAAIAQILKAVGEDPERDGLKRTPERVEHICMLNCLLVITPILYRS